MKYMNIQKMSVRRSIKLPVVAQGPSVGGVERARSPHDKVNTALGSEAKRKLFYFIMLRHIHGIFINDQFSDSIELRKKN